MTTSIGLRIFLSHSHTDNSFCQELVSALRLAGGDVWYDEHNMPPGQLLEVVERELRLRPVFVVMLSPAALRSSWVYDECKWAYTLLRREPNRIILPVLAETVEMDDIWLFLHGFKRIQAPTSLPYPRQEAIERTLHALTLISSDASPQLTENHDDLMLRAKAFEARLGFSEALDLLKLAFGINDSLVVRQHIGYVQVELSLDEEALETLDLVLQKDANDAFSWRNRANALNGLGRFSEALDSADAALKYSPEDVFALLYKGISLFRMHRYEDAVTAFDKALSLEPNFHVPWFMQALALRKLDREDEAFAAMGRAEALDPTNAYRWPRISSELGVRYLGRVAGIPK